MARVSNVRGAQYQPFYAWNSFQTWDSYKPQVIERDLGFAQRLGMNSLRVQLDYEHWYIEATQNRGSGPNQHLENVRHFIRACNRAGIEPLLEIFESPPKRPPTVEHRRAPFWEGTTYLDAGGVHSPARNPIPLYDFSLQFRNWEGPWSPMHYTRRLANEFGGNSNVVWEIMNEPGEVEPRASFATDMLVTFRDEAPNATLSMGCKRGRFNDTYDRRSGGALDVHQFHMNIVGDRNVAEEQLRQARDHAISSGKPLWCTEVQRTLEEPPSRFMPNYKSLMDPVHQAMDDGWIDGWHVWGLLMQPAYLRDMRERGRYNGIFFPGGEVFDLADARAIARDPNLNLPERREVPDAWSDHPFPYPDPDGPSQPQCGPNAWREGRTCWAAQECESGTCVNPEQRRREQRNERLKTGAQVLGAGAAALTIYNNVR